MFLSVRKILFLFVSGFVGLSASEPVDLNAKAYSKVLELLQEHSFYHLSDDQIVSILQEEMGELEADLVQNGTAVASAYHTAVEHLLFHLNQKCSPESSSSRHCYQLLSKKEYAIACHNPIVGVGLQLSHSSNRDEDGEVDDEMPIVEKVLLDWVRFKGVQPGDVILRVDGADAYQLKMNNQLIDAIRGELNSSVVLTLKREEQVFELSLERQTLNVPSAILAQIQGDLAVVSIGAFTINTVQELSDLIDLLHLVHVKGLVLDLRDSPGGRLAAASNIARYFASAGDLLSSEYLGESNEPVNFEYASENGKARDFSLAIVANAATSGAAEVLASHLQVLGVPIVGERTRGFGHTSKIYEVSENCRLKLLHMEQRLPNGSMLTSKGVIPTLEMSDGEAGNETIERALEMLRG